MNGDVWLRMVLVLVVIAFLLRALSAMLTDTARAWYVQRARIVRQSPRPRVGFPP